MKTKQRMEKPKVLLFLPLVLWPFLALAFYGMGGGRAQVDKSPPRGLNARLPDASLNSEVAIDKMGLYEKAGTQAKKDSLSALGAMASGMGFNPGQHVQAQAIQQKLALLQKEINVPIDPGVQRADFARLPARAASMKGDIDRLELLMKGMQQGNADDPEMAQLSGLMQGILDIQHPTRVEQRLRQNRDIALDSQFRAIPAVIALGQKVVQGATVKLILKDSVTLAGMLIPQGHAVYGACRITNQRLLLDIRQLRLGTSIIPVDLSVYSLDGMMGIDAPEAMLSDAATGGADQAMRNIGLLGMDQSIATQMAGAGIDAAKGLFSRKRGRIRVKLKAGTPILLRNNQKRIINP